MGQEQSTECEPQLVRPPLSSAHKVVPPAPSFQLPPKAKRKRLQDEPEILPTQQDSSLSTDGAPPPQRSLHLSSSESDRQPEHLLAPTTSPALTTPSGRFQTQATAVVSLFVPGNEDDDGEGGVDSRQVQVVDVDRASSPMHLQLVSDGHDVTANTQSTSELEIEESDEGEDTDLADLVPLSKRQRSEVFETAQETLAPYETVQEEQTQHRNNEPLDRLSNNDDFDMTELPDPPGGFEAYGIGASVVPPDYEGSHEKESNVTGNADGPEKERDESPEIKLEFASGLETHDVPIPLPEDSPSASTPDGEHSEAVRSEQDKARTYEKSLVQNEEHDEAQINDRSKQQAQQHVQRTSSTTAVEEPRAQSPGKTAPISQLDINDWLAMQRNAHPRTRSLEPILFKAAEATIFNYSLATQVVNIMLSKRDTRMAILRRHSRKKTTAAEMAEMDAQEFLPRNMSGVWTKEDDADLQNHRDAAKQLRVRDKHGLNSCHARSEFLEKDEEMKD